MVQADGVSWPLETFLDAYHFQRVNPDDPPLLTHGKVDAVFRDGAILRGCEAVDLPWWEVIAAKPEERSMAIARCDGCGALVPVSCRTEPNPAGGLMIVRSWDICGQCDEDSW